MSSRSPGGERADVRLARTMPPDRRYTLRLTATADGSILLRSASHDTTCVERISPEGAVVALPDLPADLTGLPPHFVLPQADGSLIGLVEHALTTWFPGESPRTCPVPDGFVVRDATVDRQGRLWIGGSVPIHRRSSLASRAAWAVTSDHGRTWRIWNRIGGGVLDLGLAVLSGALAEVRWIRFQGNHLVLIGLGGSPQESSTLVAVRSPRGTWHTTTWRGDVFRAVTEQAGQLTVMSHFGRRLVLTPQCRRRRDTIAPMLKSGFDSIEDDPSRVEVLDAEPSGPLSLVVAARYRADVTEMVRLGESVFSMEGTGATSLAEHGANAPEIITAVSR